MAGRPTKQGLDYFSLDVDFLADIKVRKLIRSYGAVSVSVLVCVLCNIYRGKGYYIQWDDNDIPFIVADEIGSSEDDVREIIQKAIQVGFFDQSMYDQYKILTSARIQKMFLTATYQRKERNMKHEYLINSSITCTNNSIIHANNSINHADNTQSKVKESKVKKSKDNIKETSPNGESKKGELSLSHPSSNSIDFKAFLEYFNKRFEGKLPAIRTMSDARKKAVKARAAEYGKKSVFDVLEKVANSSFLLGHNERDWICDFNWIFKPSNFVKILEGSYDNKSANTDTVKGRKESVKNLRELAVAVLTGNATKVD